jgi:hypothetical protein
VLQPVVRDLGIENVTSDIAQRNPHRDSYQGLPEQVGSRSVRDQIARARELFSGLSKGKLVRGYFSMSFMASSVRNYLQSVRVGFEALDATGKATTTQMEAEFNRVAGSRQAQEAFAQLETGNTRAYADGVEGMVKAIQSHLQNAGVGFEALDPTGQTSCREMEARFYEVVEVERTLAEAKVAMDLASRYQSVAYLRSEQLLKVSTQRISPVSRLRNALQY